MASEVKSKPVGWRAIVQSLTRPKVAVMFGLGFSSGLPFMLVGNTLGFWLREAGITLTTIGFLSWVGLAYSFKFIWAPLTDKLDLPIFGKILGRRRGWMMASQLVVMIGLLAMSYFKPEGGVVFFTALAALAACASATQDIVIDAWRIEASDTAEDMALLSSTYQLGYRGALLITDALILIVAGSVGWPISYGLMGALMTVGLCATLMAPEPRRHFVTHEGVKAAWTFKGILHAVSDPLLVFIKDHGSKALLILAAVSFYRLADFMMGPMANPFYNDLGISKEVVGGVRGSIGLIASIAGIAAGGISAVRFGLLRTLLFGAIIGPASNLAFSLMALAGPRNDIFAAAMGIDNFSGGFAGVALVGYMSTLTSVGYTATQYALLTSFYTLLGKLLKGFSGAAVDALSHHYNLMDSYAIFFAGTAVIGIPALLCCILLAATGLKPIKDS
jgi:MFS transporter, PAT family, beta-lactamase induction signal transducer AmpG